MEIDNNHVAHPPTVIHVLEQFVTGMRGDTDIPNAAIDRLEYLLRKSAIPKSDEIGAALSEPPEAES